MSSVADVEREAAGLAKTIKDLKEAGDASLLRIAAVEDGMASLRQAQDAHARASFERQASGNNRELDAYTRASEAEVAQNKSAYLAVAGVGAVRLTGHRRRAGRDQREEYQVWGLLDDPQPKTQWQRRAQQLLDRRNLIHTFLQASNAADGGTRRAWQCEAELADHLRSGPDHISRIFADSAGIGAAWIPDNPLPELERDILFRPSTWQMHEQRQMSRNPLLRPYKQGFLRAYKGQIPTTDDPAADPTLSSFTPTSQVIEAAEVAVGSQVHLNAEEDALISFESEIRSDMVDAIVFAIENARLHGDTAATHQDAIASWNTRSRLGATGLGGTNDQRRLWMGLRPLAYDLTSMTTDAGGAALTEAMILADLAKLGMESLLNADGRVTAVIEVSPETFFSTVVNFASFDAFDNVGMLASVLTGQVGDLTRTPGGLLPGQVGFLWGRFPVVVNYLLTKDLAATGLFTGAGALTGTVTHDRSRYQFFVLRGAMVKMAEDIRNNTRTLVSRSRLVFQPKDAVSSTNKTSHFRYNINA